MVLLDGCFGSVLCCAVSCCSVRYLLLFCVFVFDFKLTVNSVGRFRALDCGLFCGLFAWLMVALWLFVLWLYVALVLFILVLRFAILWLVYGYCGTGVC